MAGGGHKRVNQSLLFLNRSLSGCCPRQDKDAARVNTTMPSLTHPGLALAAH